MEITIQRSGAALVARELEYHIDPDGENEFYGSLNVIKFKAGEVEKQINVIARKDGIPEVYSTSSEFQYQAQWLLFSISAH
jgi:G-protein coupled receptor 98